MQLIPWTIQYPKLTKPEIPCTFFKDGGPYMLCKRGIFALHYLYHLLDVEEPKLQKIKPLIICNQLPKFQPHNIYVIKRVWSKASSILPGDAFFHPLTSLVSFVCPLYKDIQCWRVNSIYLSPCYKSNADVYVFYCFLLFSEWFIARIRNV